MQQLIFFINGSGSPFWKKEKTVNGYTYYDDLCWPDEISTKLKEDWKTLLILYDSHSNPIDIRFPSFWDESMCDIFNRLVHEFLEKCVLELKAYEIVDKFTPLKQDPKLWEYRLDPIKYHLNLNSSFSSQEDFKKYLESIPETKSEQIAEVSYYKRFEISRKEYEAFNRKFLTFGNYNHFPIEFCPLTNRTFLAIMYSQGHGPDYHAMRIKREDILHNEIKVTDLIKNYFR